MQQGRFWLKNHQCLVIAGCFTGDNEDLAWMIHTDEIIPDSLTHYSSSVEEEADHRIWRHATQSSARNILLYSPDTDVDNIGLYLIHQPPKNYIIQLNVPHSSDTKYLNLNNLKKAFSHDPDLSTVPKEDLGAIRQTLFISTGCDYISHFKTMGKLPS